jgi:type I restriction enzyme S subunit
MSRWKEYKLSELCELIGGGTPKTSVAEYWNGDIPWLSVTDFNTGRKYCFDAEKKITEKGLKESSTKILKKGQIIISARGTVGVISMLGNDMAFNQSNYGINAKEGLTTNDFLYYLLKDNISQFVSNSYGAVFDTITKQTFEQITVDLPPLPEQTAIAEVLSSLDDKIDLLHRQNKTLEQLAETLFRQWFVEEAEDSWKEDVLEKYISFDPREKIDRNKAYQFFEMKCLSNVDMNISDGVYRIVSSASSFRNFDTLLAKITPCLENGKTGFVMHLGDDEVARGSTEFIVMRSKGLVSPYWIYCLARDSDFREKAIQSMTGTSGRQRVQIDLLKNITVKVDAERMKKFHDTVSPFFLKIKSNQTQIKTLTKLRDALLPKLVNGEVRVQMN